MGVSDHSGDDLSNNEKSYDSAYLEDNKVDGTTATADGGITYTEGIDPDKERRVVRKIDRFVVPFVCMLYLFSFLDR